MRGSLRAAASRLRMGNNPSTVGLSNSATVNKIQETISDNCVVIFSKTTCAYCKMAKKLFQDMNVNYTAIELDMYENGSQFQDILHQMTGGRTVPRVFINGAFIGGATDTQRLHQEAGTATSLGHNPTAPPPVHQAQICRQKWTRKDLFKKQIEWRNTILEKMCAEHQDRVAEL
ncbi:glutaredoxin 2 isoform X1 [Pelodiscus sinensis]|uniref:glutaredoxin 2 isoform X1 n=1 Tax=Pelodiscus sinensis TaxID=13735 RepID=UPI003F6C91B5